MNYASLAFGVTTIHDPSNDTARSSPPAEMARAGRIVAPRIFSTGTILYGATGAVQGGGSTASTTRAPTSAHEGGRRVQREELQPAAPRPAPAGAPGRARARHDGRARGRLALPAQHEPWSSTATPASSTPSRWRIYDDVIQLWGATRSGYTPTLVVAYGGSGARTTGTEDQRLGERAAAAFVPREVSSTRARAGGPWRPRTS
jgi:hypothetical protein